MRSAVVVIAALGLGAASHAQQVADNPEPAIRALVRAMYANDVDGYNRVTVSHPRRALLTSGGRTNTARLLELTQAPNSLQMKSRRPFLHRGREASPADGKYPVGTTALYSVAHSGNSMVAMLVRQEEGWKVDLRWWIAMMDLQTTPQRPGTPEFAARAITAAAAAMDPAAAAKYIVPGANVDVIFRGAQREPSGMFDALAEEMPVVELQPGEFYPVDDRVVEGSFGSDTKLLLGLFGVVEIPYVVRRVGKEWRVEPQPYYRYFNK